MPFKFNREDDPLKSVEDAMEKCNWNFHRIDDETIMSGVNTGDRNFIIVIRHDKKRESILFFFHPAKESTQVLQALRADRVPFLCVHSNAGHTEQQVADVCQFLLQHNYQMVLGNFERDPRDGEIRFRIALPYRNNSVTTEQANWCLEIGTISADNGMEKVEQLLASGGRMEI